MSNDAPLYARTLRNVGTEHANAIVVDAGLATSMQSDLFQVAFPERYVNLGIAEANAVGFASGLARRGFRPIVHSFSNFLARRAHDQIAISIALPKLPVLLVGGSCGVFDGRNGPSHFASDDLATFTSLPGFKVYEPADGEDLKNAMREAMTEDGPSYLRLRRHGMRTGRADEAKGGNGTHLVHAATEDARVTIVVIGNLLEEAFTAVRILADQDVHADLFHVVRIKPLAAEKILASARRTQRPIVIENHCAVGGGAQAVTVALASYGLNVSCFTLPDRFLPAGDPRWLLAQVGLDANSLADRIVALLHQGAA
ncbi:transketolase family protein [Bradyrhizobium pachyrhizi]|uniref:transketolase family protein n=1 Tax=Bradyrhizobium pachyrhizi TaxID=280333 RepID=UPI00067D1DF6|nr:transketolase C-terminal domain-containing protein [Bradyrhizobium pachyrhizi]